MAQATVLLVVWSRLHAAPFTLSILDVIDRLQTVSFDQEYNVIA